MTKQSMVTFDALGVFEVREANLLDVVSAGATAVFALRAKSNNTCGTDINQDCVDNTNNQCVYANPACGADTYCSGISG